MAAAAMTTIEPVSGQFGKLSMDKFYRLEFDGESQVRARMQTIPTSLSLVIRFFAKEILGPISGGDDFSSWTHIRHAIECSITIIVQSCLMT